MSVYYNEFDPKAAAWLRELIKQGHIAYGDVDERSIEDVQPADLTGYGQCHFFAGIGVWSYALRRAGWDDERPVWTGSCPCQPFSAAGKGAGFADERHLWPAFHHLISVCRPPVVFGEQVASKDGLGWLDLVQADLEGSGYASGAVDLCAAGVGAPHIRQRLWWVAERRMGHPVDGGRQSEPHGARSDDPRMEPGRRQQEQFGKASGDADRVAGAAGIVEHATGDGWIERRADATGGHDGLGPHTGRAQGASDLEGRGRDGRPGPVNGVWRDADWLFCRDGKWRPVESGSQPLVDGAPARVGRLRGYGNAIVAPAAQAFIEAYEESRIERESVRMMSDLAGDVFG